MHNFVKFLAYGSTQTQALHAICFLNIHRNVTDSDILALERRLLQTMDMIVSKKKRWAKKGMFFLISDFRKSLCHNNVFVLCVGVALQWQGGRCINEGKTKTNRLDFGAWLRVSPPHKLAVKVSFTVIVNIKLKNAYVLCIVPMILDFCAADLSLIQQEVDALEELSRQLFLETVDLQSTKVTHVHMLVN